MSSPVSNTTNVFFDEEFESFRNTMKEEAQATLEKTSSQAKDLLKKQANDSVESCVPYLTSPVKVSITGTLPVPLAVIANTSLDVCADTASKKVSHKSIDKSVDTVAKKAIDDSVDYSVNSSKSYFSAIYDYFSK
jgi:hypothetical protein